MGLELDGGPWVGGMALSRLSPWAELTGAAVAGGLLGVTVLPAGAALAAVGGVAWLALSPAALAMSLIGWVATGDWLWLLDTSALAPLGWGLIAAVAADGAQAAAPWPFRLRLPAAIAAAVVVVSLAGLTIAAAGSLLAGS